ncbi:Vacuolar protein sorting-associated protein 13C [Toxocara canis]|uniref:Vacuolar protein sorting-associated protein 13C n=1 Tax=Toxocara canis TaxID=6265 RepID=A0A0B2V9D5_TOXCA|nr:Vacuolar protein sorting-associated protein 13C [Toxocara canis]
MHHFHMKWSSLASCFQTVDGSYIWIDRLGFFERCCVFYSHQQLQNEILSHYLKQAIKQLHVLIFGLDVIGNPYGLVRDLSSGVQDFFYQPYKGAIKGPEEFAGGVRQGVRGLFGATVGGASGAVSRITGTLGKGLATLACDEEYARRRQRMFNERSRGISGTVACGAEGVGRGFCEGVAGIVAKPIEGARTGGVGGFARGVGKGVIGAAVRPVSGVVDFASCSFGALKTAAIGAEEVQQLRPPRVILIDKIIRPYSAEQSLGAKIFREAQCGSSTRTDHFIAHKRLSSTSAVIITDKAAVLLKRVAGGSYWRMQWRLVFSEMKPPEVCSKRLYLKRKKERRGFLRRRSPEGRMLQFDSERDAHEVAEKITSAYNAELQR